MHQNNFYNSCLLNNFIPNIIKAAEHKTVSIILPVKSPIFTDCIMIPISVIFGGIYLPIWGIDDERLKTIKIRNDKNVEAVMFFETILENKTIVSTKNVYNIKNAKNIIKYLKSTDLSSNSKSVYIFKTTAEMIAEPKVNTTADANFDKINCVLEIFFVIIYAAVLLDFSFATIPAKTIIIASSPICVKFLTN